MYMCICAAVPEDEVRECIEHGARTVGEIGDQCRAGTGCGGCHARLQKLLDEARANQPVGAEYAA